MPVPEKTPKYAFRCRACGHLETSGAAAESHTPAACSACGAGVSFNPRTGARSSHPENWEVLADMTAEQLANYDLHLDLVERHTPWRAARSSESPKQVSVSASEKTQSGDSPSGG